MAVIIIFPTQSPPIKIKYYKYAIISYYFLPLNEKMKNCNILGI